MFRTFTVAATMVATLALASGAALAADPKAEIKPEDILKMRQGIFMAAKMNIGPLGAVAKGEAAFAPNLAINAQNLAALARIAPMGFPKGSEAIKGSESLPDIWTKPEAYKAAMEKWQAESGKLAEVALKGDAEAVKAQIPNVSKACKGCHQDFRKE